MEDRHAAGSAPCCENRSAAGCLHPHQRLSEMVHQAAKPTTCRRAVQPEDHRRETAAMGPVQRAGDMVDAAGRAFFHLDGGAELAEPEGPVRPGGRIQDFQLVDGRPGFGIGGPFGPADRAGLRARACQ